MSETLTKTFVAKVRNLDEESLMILKDFCDLSARVEHALFQDFYVKKKNINDLKRNYQIKFGINARHFNSIADKLKGKARNWRENQVNKIKLYTKKIKSSKNKIIKLKKKESNIKRSRERKKIKFSLHHLQRSHVTKIKRLERFEKELKEGIPRICFGGKKLFKSQHFLKENRFESFDHWKKEFTFKRSNQLYFLGSTDRTLGNGNCHYIASSIKRDTLKITLTSSLLRKYKKDLKKEKYFYLKKVFFNDDNEIKKKKKGECTFSEIIENYLTTGPKGPAGPLTYRLILENEKTVKIAASLRIPKPEKISVKDYGAIGVDLNKGFVSIGIIDRFGNPLYSYDIGMNTHGKKENQRQEIIRNCVQKICKKAFEQKTPIIIEDLDFSTKKANAKQYHKSYNRMISSFPYKKFKSCLEHEATKFGIQIITVNPAFTSVIGFGKFSHGYGLTPHQGAAVAIARRGLNFSENLSSRTARSLPGDFVSSLKKSSRDGDRHVWAFWGIFASDIPKLKSIFFGRIGPPFEKPFKEQGRP